MWLALHLPHNPEGHSCPLHRMRHPDTQLRLPNCTNLDIQGGIPSEQSGRISKHMISNSRRDLSKVHPCILIESLEGWNSLSDYITMMKPMCVWMQRAARIRGSPTRSTRPTARALCWRRYTHRRLWWPNWLVCLIIIMESGHDIELICHCQHGSRCDLHAPISWAIVTRISIWLSTPPSMEPPWEALREAPRLSWIH